MKGSIVRRLMIALVVSGATHASGPTAYVINATGETLSKIELRTNVVTNSIEPLGSDVDSYPNQIVIRDTLAYVIASGTDEIQIINLNTERTVGWIRFGAGQNPYWMAFLNDQVLYVTLLVDNSLAKVDLTTRQVVKTTPVGLSPEGVIVVHETAFVAVTGFDFGSWSWKQGKLVAYDTRTDSVIAELNVGKNPQFLDIDRQGRLHVSCTGDYGATPGTIYIIDPGARAVLDSIAIGGQPGQISIGPDDIGYLAAGGWTGDGEVYTYHAATGDVLRGPSNPIYVDSGATGVVTFQDSSAFVACFGDKINRVNAAGQKLGTYVMGDGPAHLDFNHIPGDATGDWEVNVGDAVYIVNYIFKNGSRPPLPVWRADVNADGAINVGDAVCLVNYIFKGGPRPLVGATWLR